MTARVMAPALLAAGVVLALVGSFLPAGPAGTQVIRDRRSPEPIIREFPLVEEEEEIRNRRLRRFCRRKEGRR